MRLTYVGKDDQLIDIGDSTMEVVRVKDGFYAPSIEGYGSSWVDTSYDRRVYSGPDDYDALQSMVLKVEIPIFDQLEQLTRMHVEYNRDRAVLYHASVAAYETRQRERKLLPFHKKVHRYIFSVKEQCPRWITYGVNPEVEKLEKWKKWINRVDHLLLQYKDETRLFYMQDDNNTISKILNHITQMK